MSKLTLQLLRLAKYRAHRSLSWLHCRLKRWIWRAPRSTDLCVVADIGEKGWILEKIGREIMKCWKGDSFCHFVTFPFEFELGHLPDAKVYFFTHYIRFREFLGAHRQSRATLVVWFTHPHRGEVDEDTVDLLRRADRVVCTCSLHRDALLAQGLDARKLSVVLGGVDLTLFNPEDREVQGIVGICGRYYPRKNPNLIFELARLRPRYCFEILGPPWKPLIERVKAAEVGNIVSVDLPYASYPDRMRRWKVYLSASHLEGGPISLIEAAACGAIPVCSDTGFARDVIRSGVDGFVFETDAGASEVAEMLDRAMTGEIKRSPDVSSYSWSAFGDTICRLIRETHSSKFVTD